MSAPVTYGGQAVIEGVVIRGRRTLALACRRPNGEIYRYREPLRSILHRSRAARLPFARGIFTLWETLSFGMRMLMKSADIQMEDERSSTPSTGTAAATTGVVALAVAFGLGLFVGVPYLASELLGRFVASELLLNVLEGLLRLVLFLGYLGAISFMPDIRRVFAYHGAEHMTIHAFEHGDPLDAAHITPYPTAHPRCGTAFLLLVVLVAIALFAFLPRTNVIVDLLVRILLVIPVAAIAYEVLRFGARHERHPLMRALVAPGLFLQRITTRRPDDGMIEVAVASLQEALAGDEAAA
ncbi:MAG: DUF1385 domain-containing protein [Candidatus Limnocylindria bacterium]